jgi:replicative DNA helicase
MTAPPSLLYSVEAEQGVIGAALYDNALVGKVEGLEARHFREPLYVDLWAEITEQVRRGRLAEPVSLASKFAADARMVEMGGVAHLGDLYSRSPPFPAAISYARLLSELSARRELITVGEQMMAAARDTGVGIHDTLATAEKMVGELARGAEPGETALVPARAAAETTLDELHTEAQDGKPKGMMTGLRCFDRRLGGLKPGHLIVIAGRPSMAKSGLARQAAHGGAGRNPRHLFPFFCLEMNRRELSERTLSELAYRDPKIQSVAYRDLDKLPAPELRKLEDLLWQIPANFILDDTATLSVAYVRRRCFALRRRGPIGAIFIDYLQIMQRPKAQGRNDAAVIGEMTAELKRLARELDCAVVLLSQLSRGVESRDDKRPMLSDLRESGSIEQDANSVLFPFREVYYVERAEPRDGTSEHLAWEDSVAALRRRMDVICAKNRGGPVGTDRQEYFAEYDAISDGPEDRQ